MPFLTSDDFGADGFFIDINARRRISLDFAAHYPNGRLRANELLVKVKGPNQITAYNGDEPDPIVLVSGTIWGALVRRELVDPHYLVAALSSNYAATARSRLRTNLNVEFLSPADLLSLDLPLPKLREAQLYIGDKVRQAERLRACALKYYEEAQNFFSKFSNESTDKRCFRLDSSNLGNRLDHLHYRSDLLDSYQKVKTSPYVVLGDKTHFSGLTDGDHGNPVYGEGPIYLRATELEGFLINPRHCANIKESYALSIPTSCYGNPGDVVFSIVGTLGLAAVIQSNDRYVLSRGMAKVRPLELPAHYVKSYMRSQSFRNELLRNSVGSVQRGVYLEALNAIPIPVLDGSQVSAIAHAEETSDRMMLLADTAVQSAKFLVEGLIEGRLSQEELRAAGNALERGDHSLDREILARLTEDGINVEGKRRLFPNVDEWYAAIDQAESAGLYGNAYSSVNLYAAIDEAERAHTAGETS